MWGEDHGVFERALEKGITMEEQHRQDVMTHWYHLTKKDGLPGEIQRRLDNGENAEQICRDVRNYLISLGDDAGAE